METFIPATDPQDPQVPNVDTNRDDPWGKSCVLTLDGGGSRGYASLLILKELKDKIGEIEKGDADEPHMSSFYPILEVPRENGDTSSSIEPMSASGRLRTRTLTRDGAEVTISRDGSDSNTTVPSITEGYLLCHYFDYIAGTSTGGLNAIMLGRLRMDVDDCIARYPPLARDVFGKKRSILGRIARGTKYNEENLELAIKEIVNSRIPKLLPNQDVSLYTKYPSPEDLCKTIVVANENTEFDSQPYLFRTYPSTNPAHAHEADAHEIWQVARATSAADTFFKPMKLNSQANSRPVEYTDGGLGNNNPALLVLDEVLIRKGTEQPTEGLSVFMSIGTGQKPTKRQKAKKTVRRYLVNSLKPIKSLASVLGRLKDVGTAVDRDHNHMVRLFKATNFDEYYRWTGGEDVGGLSIDKWKEKRRLGKPPTPQFIEEKVKEYMQQPHIQAEVAKAAKALVARRRARAIWNSRDGLWARYTYCVRVQCPYDADNWYGSSGELREHIISNHPDKVLSEETLDDLVRGFYVHHPKFPGGPF